MIFAFLVLIACELVGEVVRTAFVLPIPGPVIGMFLLGGMLGARKDKTGTPAVPAALAQTAETLIGHMGLLIVPAGVGIVAQAAVLENEWLPVTAALIGSTLLSLVATGLVMHWTLRSRSTVRSARGAPPGKSMAESRSPS
jgi:holin-like protein